MHGDGTVAIRPNGGAGDDARIGETTARASARQSLRGETEVDMRTRTGHPDDASSFSTETITGVRRALAATALREASSAQLGNALSELTGEAHALGYPAERAVIALKHAWRGVRRPTVVGPGEWEVVYQTALTDMLGLFFHGSPG